VVDSGVAIDSCLESELNKDRQKHESCRVLDTNANLKGIDKK
jgi:hypothetical protein